MGLRKSRSDCSIVDFVVLTLMSWFFVVNVDGDGGRDEECVSVEMTGESRLIPSILRSSVSEMAALPELSE